MMAQALNLALYGMGTVFIFLTVLVGLTMLMSKLVIHFSPPEEPKPSRQSPVNKSLPSPELLAAISAAVKQYRERH